MAGDFAEKFKKVVHSNFNLSREHYVDMEEKYDFFLQLTDKLVDKIQKPAEWRNEKLHILDVGCGTGASTARLKKLFPNAEVEGLDFSEEMLAEAKKNLPDVKFVCGDGELLGDYYAGQTFDLIIYPASIFLMPHQAQALEAANALLAKDGVIAASVLLGLKEKDYTPMDSLPPFKGIIKNEDLADVMADYFAEIGAEKIQIALDREKATMIYKIEALSAGAFPGKPYEERQEAIQAVIAEAEAKGLTLVQEWNLLTGYKK